MVTKGESLDVVVVGAMTVEVEIEESMVPQVHAFLWSASGNDYYSAGLHDLSVAAGIGTTPSIAAGVNIRGEVVGQMGSGSPGEGQACIWWPTGSSSATITDLTADLASCLLEDPPGIALDISDDPDPHVVGVLRFCDADPESCAILPMFRGFYIRGSSETHAVQLLNTTDAGLPNTYIFGVNRTEALGIFFDGDDIYACGFQSGFESDGCVSHIGFPSCPSIVGGAPANFAREEGMFWAVSEGNPTTATPTVLEGTNATYDAGFRARGSEPGGIIVGFGQVIETEVIGEETVVVGCPYEALIWPDRSASPVSLNASIDPFPDRSWAEAVSNCDDSNVRVAGSAVDLGVSAVLIDDALGTACGRFVDDVSFAAKATQYGVAFYRAVGVNTKGLMAVIGVFSIADATYYEAFVLTHRADLNADAHIDGADLTIVLGHWLGTDPIADVDGDGMVNGADMAILLGNWTGSSTFRYLPSPCDDPCADDCASIAALDAVLPSCGFEDADDFVTWCASADSDAVSLEADALAALVAAAKQ